MTSAMSVAMSLMRVPSGIGSSAAVIAFATWHLRFLGTLPLPVWCGRVWDGDFRVHEIMIRFWGLQRGPADINAVDQSAARLLCQDIVQTCFSPAAVGGVGHTPLLGVQKKVFTRASLSSSAKPSSSLPLT